MFTGTEIVDFGWGAGTTPDYGRKKIFNSGLNKIEDKVLSLIFNNIDWDHDFAGKQIKPDQLKHITSAIQRKTGGKVVYYWAMKGYGCVDFHDDKGTDIDINDCIAFMIPIMIKYDNRKFSKNVEVDSFDCMRLISVDKKSNMVPKNVRYGCLHFFDQCKEHAIITSCGWYILCGLLDQGET